MTPNEETKRNMNSNASSNPQDQDQHSPPSSMRRMIFSPEEKNVGLRQRRRPVDSKTIDSTSESIEIPSNSIKGDGGINSEFVVPIVNTPIQNGMITGPIQCIPLNDIRLPEEKDAVESTVSDQIQNAPQHSSVPGQQQQLYSTHTDYFPPSSDQIQHPRTVPLFECTLHTYSDDSIAGRVLTKLASIFIYRDYESTSQYDNETVKELNHPQQQQHSNNLDRTSLSPITPSVNNTKAGRTPDIRAGSAFAAFLSLLLTTCASYMLSPMRDAAALAIGVSHIPTLTLASTILALASSVPVGWLFEAPNKERRGRSWRDKIGLTRGETQGTSLALFYRCFAVCLIGYALTFKIFEFLDIKQKDAEESGVDEDIAGAEGLNLLAKCGKIFYVAFFLVVHLMKLHSISLIWGVAQEAMEYEEQAELREQRRRELMNFNLGIQPTITNSDSSENFENSSKMKTNNESDDSGGGKKRSSARLKRLAFVGFGGTVGGILGSVFVSLTAHTLRLSGLLVVAAVLLLLSAELSIELGQIMYRHWEEGKLEELQREQQRGGVGVDNVVVLLDAINVVDKTSSSSDDDINPSLRRVSSLGGMKRIASGNTLNSQNDIDPSLRRVTSLGVMKRIASGNTLNSQNGGGSGIDTSIKKVSSLGSMKRIASGNSISSIRRNRNSGTNLSKMDQSDTGGKGDSEGSSIDQDCTTIEDEQEVDDNSFKQRLLRGVLTIFRSRLLMTIFIYNALYATTTVLLSFQRAELVANRSSSNNGDSVDSDTAFLAKINMASSVAVFALQASGMGAFIAGACGRRGTLSLMPLVRLLGVAMLALWHIKADGEPPNLMLFLVLDEFTKVVNFAIAKPVRESLWSDLSNEARYEAKPIVDTLANRWGGGSAAFLIALFDKIMHFTGLGEVLEDGTKSLFGFPPLLFLCSISAAWWAFVSVDLGNIRHRIDMELKKHKED